MGWVRPLSSSDNSLWVSVAEEEGQGPEVQGIPTAGSVSPLLQEKQKGIVQKKKKSDTGVLYAIMGCSQVLKHGLSSAPGLPPTQPSEEALRSAAAALTPV